MAQANHPNTMTFYPVQLFFDFPVKQRWQGIASGIVSSFYFIAFLFSAVFLVWHTVNPIGTLEVLFGTFSSFRILNDLEIALIYNFFTLVLQNTKH